MTLGSLLRIESYSKGIVLSSAFNVVAHSVALFTGIVFAFYFGTQAKTDVYYYALNTVLILVMFLTSLDSSVVIPESMRIAEQVNRDQSQSFLTFFLYIFGALALVVTLILFFDPIFYFRLISRFDAEILTKYSVILKFTIPLLLLQFIAQYLVDILTSYKYFTMPMLMRMLNRVVVLVCLVCFQRWLDILSAVLGALLATVIQIVFLMLMMKKALGWSFRFRWIQLEGRILRNMALSLLGNFFTALAAYVPIFLLSSFPAGILTALSYGQRFALLPALFFTAQVSSVVGIKLNELYAKRDWAGINDLFIRSVKLLLLILLPLSLFLSLFSTEIITVLLERGAFGSDSVETTALFFRIFVLSLPFLAINAMVARLFMAAQKIPQGFGYQILTNTALILMIIFGVRYIGAAGYPLADLCLHVANIFALFFVLRLVFPGIRYQLALLSFGGMVLRSLLVLGVAYFVRRYTLDQGSLVALATGAVVFFSSFLASLLIVPIDWEISQTLRTAVNNWRGRRG